VEELGRLYLGYNCRSLEVTNETAFTGARAIHSPFPNHLIEIDLRNPAIPHACRYEEFDSEPLRESAMWEHALYQASDRGIEIFDIRNTCATEFHDVIEIPEGIGKLKVFENRLWVLSGEGDVRLYGLENPLMPAPLGFIAAGSRAWDVVSRENRVFLAEGGNGLGIYDLESPFALEWVESLWIDSYGTGLFPFLGGFAVAGRDIAFVSLEEGSSPRIIGEIAFGEPPLVDLSPTEHLLFATTPDSLLVFDIADPTQPRLAGLFPTLDGESPLQLISRGRRAYLLTRVSPSSSQPTRLTIFRYTGPTSQPGPSFKDVAGDLDKSGRVDSRDLLMLRENWYEETD
jgi:hypothetical protein